MTLAELADHLHRYAATELTLDALRDSFLPALDADPLDVTESDSAPWDTAPEDARLFWRLLHLFDSAAPTAPADEAALRRLAGRLAHAIDTAERATTLELLPLIEDQERFCTIAERHARGIISRTGFLSVIAESGYPAHVKLWLQHADLGALGRLCAALATGRYEAAGAMVERAP